MLGNISPISKPYCQKILPLTYDDSLSYYEAVCKLTSKMNEIIANINDHLEDYIRQQLDNLFINAIYDEKTETLVLVLDMGV